MKNRLTSVRHVLLKASSINIKYTNCMLATKKIYRATQTSIKERLQEIYGQVPIYYLQAVLDYLNSFCWLKSIFKMSSYTQGGSFKSIEWWLSNK